MVYNRTVNLPSRNHHSWKAILIVLVIILAVVMFGRAKHHSNQQNASQAADARVVQMYNVPNAQRDLNRAIHQYNHGKMATRNLDKARYVALRISNPSSRNHELGRINRVTNYMHANH